MSSRKAFDGSVWQFRIRRGEAQSSFLIRRIGLGAIAAKAHRISDGMFLAAARTIADMSPAKHDPQANLLPPLVRSRELSFHVAMAVAKQAQADGLADITSDEALAAAVKAKMWEPIYADYVRLSA